MIICLRNFIEMLETEITGNRTECLRVLFLHTVGFAYIAFQVCKQKYFVGKLTFPVIISNR